jgi:hypothetical protein
MVEVADKNPGTRFALDPATRGKVAVCGADGVGMDAEPPGEVADAGQALGRRETPAENPEQELSA